MHVVGELGIELYALAAPCNAKCHKARARGIFHVDRGDGRAACGRSELNTSAWIPKEVVPEDSRCKKCDHTGAWDGDMRHGHNGTYRDGCRCDLCIAWNRARVAGQPTSRERHRLQPKRVPHGLDGYDNYDCRCKICKASYSAKYNALQEETASRAFRRGEVWTPQELELLARRDLTAVQIALMTQRTFAAIKSRRRKTAPSP